MQPGEFWTTKVIASDMTLLCHRIWKKMIIIMMMVMLMYIHALIIHERKRTGDVIIFPVPLMHRCDVSGSSRECHCRQLWWGTATGKGTCQKKCRDGCNVRAFAGTRGSTSGEGGMTKRNCRDCEWNFNLCWSAVRLVCCVLYVVWVPLVVASRSKRLWVCYSYGITTNDFCGEDWKHSSTRQTQELGFYVVENHPRLDKSDQTKYNGHTKTF